MRKKTTKIKEFKAKRARYGLILPQNWKNNQDLMTKYHGGANSSVLSLLKF